MAFPIPRAAFAQHTIALGKTRSGKSSKLRVIVEDLLDGGKPVCLIDPKGDWWGLKSSADGKHAGYPVVIFGGEHADVPINEHSGSAVAELIASGNRPCIIDLGGWMIAPRTRFFIEFASTLFKLTRGQRWLAIDECHNFSPKGKLFDPEAAKMLHWANRLASEGAGKGLVLLSASQRPQKVHNDYLTSHETLIACRAAHKADRDAFKDWVDGCGDPAIGKEMLANLANIERSQAYVWSPEIKFGPKLISWPMFRTYDSFKPQDAAGPVTLQGWASVDLEEVKTKLAIAVEEAKANDPKALKAEVARLTRELSKATSNVVEKINMPDRAEIEAANADGYRIGWSEGHRIGIGTARAAARIAIDAMNELGADIVRLIDSQEQDQELNRKKPAKIIPKNIPAAAIAQPVERGVSIPKGAGSIPAGRSNGSGHIEGPLQKIIDAIRWWNVLGIASPKQVQVAFVAGYSHKSGTWSTYLARLRSQGLIEGKGDLNLTSAGRHAANEPDISPTAEDVQRAVMGKIDGPLQRILTPLLRSYPNSMSQADTASAAGYSNGSGTWSTYLARMRGLDLITGRGELCAADWMFPH